MPLEYIRSNRGKEHLIYDGHRFILDKVTESKTTWNCAERRNNNCKSRIHTSGGEVIKYKDTHNHTPDAAKLGAKRVVAEIKKMAQTTTERPQQIVATVSQGISPSIQAQLPAIRVMKRNLQRVRQRVNYPLPVPNNLNLLVIPPQYQQTASGNNFLLHDSGPGNDRILIFGTQASLEYLARSKDIFADGTFKASPGIFYQLYTVHALIQHDIVPLVFALLPNKTSATYQRFFQKLLDLEPRINPRRIMTDFEMAAKNGFREVFPETTQHGCLFHFGQCIWRNLQQHGQLQQNYKDDAEFALKIKCLNALAFCRPEHVINYFEELTQDQFFGETRAMEDFMDYFETTWIGMQRRNVRRDPLFRIPEWNVHERVVEKIAKTNNNIEGWHKAFHSLLECDHPTIWRLIDALKKQHSLNELRITQYLAGETPPPPRQAYRDSAERIKRVVDDYDNRPAVEFLRSIAHNLNLNV